MCLKDVAYISSLLYVGNKLPHFSGMIGKISLLFAIWQNGTFILRLALKETAAQKPEEMGKRRKTVKEILSFSANCLCLLCRTSRVFVLNG